MTVEELLTPAVLPNRVIEIVQERNDGSLTFLYYGTKDDLLPIFKNKTVIEWKSFPNVLSIHVDG